MVLILIGKFFKNFIKALKFTFNKFFFREYPGAADR